MYMKTIEEIELYLKVFVSWFQLKVLKGRATGKFIPPV
jgi:hypothetical protein